MEHVEITIGGNCNLTASRPVYAIPHVYTGGSGTVGSASFVIDHFELYIHSSATATTICGPLVGTGVTGEVTVQVTGSAEASKQLDLYLQDIDKLSIDHSRVAPFGYNTTEPDNPRQPLKLDSLDVDTTGTAVFAYGNTSVEIGTLSGSGTMVFSSSNESLRPGTVEITEQVDTSDNAPLKLNCEGTDSSLTDMVFFNGAGIAALDSASCFFSLVNGKSAVKTDEGIKLVDSAPVKTPTHLEATFDKNSYEYGSYITASVSLRTNAGEPVPNEFVKIQTAETGTPLASAVLDENGTAELKIPVDTALINYGEDTLNALYEGGESYSASTCRLTFKTDPQIDEIAVTDATIQLTAEIAEPALYEVPAAQLEVSDDAFYTAKLVWSPQTTTFQPDITYSVSIQLIPNQGFDMNHVGAVTYQGQTVTKELQADGTLLLPKVREYSPLSSDNVFFKTKQTQLTEVPNQLKGQYASIEVMQEALYQSIVSQSGMIPAEQTAHYDVQLMVSVDGGKSWATSEGVVTGYSNVAFGPNDPITREQFAIMLYRFAQTKGYDTTRGGMAIREFADFQQISDYAVDAMTWAVNAGIISGTSGTTLSPQGTATRAQVAVMLMRFCKEYVTRE